MFYSYIFNIGLNKFETKNGSNTPTNTFSVKPGLVFTFLYTVDINLNLEGPITSIQYYNLQVMAQYNLLSLPGIKLRKSLPETGQSQQNDKTR